MRLYEPTEGQILLNGYDVREYDIDEYRAVFSTIFQNFRQYAFSVAENVLMGACGTEQDERKVREALGKCGILDRIDSHPNGIHARMTKEFDEDGIELSGGQLQKLVMARILYRNAPIVILDEPTAALDALMESQIYQIIAQQFSEKTCVFISHRLSSVIFCDKIILMDQGRILDCAPHETLLQRSELYARLWEAQSQPYKEGEGDEPNE